MLWIYIFWSNIIGTVSYFHINSPISIVLFVLLIQGGWRSALRWKVTCIRCKKKQENSIVTAMLWGHKLNIQLLQHYARQYSKPVLPRPNPVFLDWHILTAYLIQNFNSSRLVSFSKRCNPWHKLESPMR